MADDLTLPATGAAVGTDEVDLGGGAVHVQYVKLVDGTEEGTDRLPGSAARGLAVEPRARASRIQVSSSGLTTATNAYVAADQMGAILEFPNAARAAGGTGTIQSATLLDKAAIVGAVDLFLFDRTVTVATDNAAAAFSDADMAFCLGILRFPPPIVNANNGLAAIEASGLGFDLDGTSLFGAMVTRSGHTFFGAASDLVVSLHVVQD